LIKQRRGRKPCGKTNSIAMIEHVDSQRKSPDCSSEIYIESTKIHENSSYLPQKPCSKTNSIAMIEHVDSQRKPPDCSSEIYIKHKDPREFDISLAGD
jgi:hypothetical protein